MGGVSASGWPYVTPDDHPIDFPAHSLALSNLLESRVRLRGHAVQKVAGQHDIPIGTPVGFAATISGIAIGTPVLGIITHIGGLDTGTVPSETYVTSQFTGADMLPGWLHPFEFTFALDAEKWRTFVVPAIATATTVSLTYTVITVPPDATYYCLSPSTIILAAV